jgi:hypothetical protein
MIRFGGSCKRPLMKPFVLGQAAELSFKEAGRSGNGDIALTLEIHPPSSHSLAVIVGAHRVPCKDFLLSGLDGTMP